MFEYADFLWNALLIGMAMLVVLLIIAIFIDYQTEDVARWLTLAERDFNNNVNAGMAHGGRKEKVEERKEWNKLAQVPFVQINSGAYRSIAHDIVENNEKELAGKGATMGRAAITAFLLRELYEGNVEAAQSKIFLETLNGGGKPPYIAPGIYELVGFEHFDPEKGFPPHAGVNRFLLQWVVIDKGFPRAVQFVTTDGKTGIKKRLTGERALLELLQANL